MQKEHLKSLIQQGKSTRQIAEITNKSQTTVRYWLKKLELKTSPNKYNKKSEYCCRYCGEEDKNKMKKHDKERFSHVVCAACHSLDTIERGRRKKILLVEYKGGCCEKCGYDKNYAAFDFHHINPKNKDPTFKNLRYWSVEKAKSEVDKCLLLCANCHREEHYQGN